MVGELKAAGRVTIPTTICAVFKPDRTSLGRHAKWVIHNRHYVTFSQFTEAILGFCRETLPKKWREFTDTVTDNFRIISLKKYKVV